MSAQSFEQEMRSALEGKEPCESKVSVVVEDGIVKTVVTGTDLPCIDFATYFTKAWQNNASRTAMVDTMSDSRYTYGEMLDACRRVAAGLRRRGLRTADVVAFHGVNSCELLVAICGTFFAGGTAALIKNNLTEGEVHCQLEDARPKFVFCDSGDIKKIENACAGITSVEETIIITGDSGGAPSLSELKQTPLDDSGNQEIVCPDTVLVIIYSSGTTGLPKGVQLTHRNVVSHVVMHGLCDKSVFDKDDVFMNIAPVTHIGGFSLIFGHLGHGPCVVLVHTLDLSMILAAIAKYKPNSTLLFPTFVAKLAEHPLLDKVGMSSIKKLLIGGTTASSSVLRAITLKLGLIGVIQVYGMTELSGCIAFSTPRMDDFKSVGNPAPFVEIKVVDQTTRKPLGPYQLGEICVKSPGNFKSYINNPEATAEAYENGFIHTGDVGEYSPDGRIFVRGRLKELIKCMDQQVAPAELEELLTADPGVLQAVVVGVPHPHFGEAARAFVLPRQHLRPGSPEEQTETRRVQELIAGKLAAHKHLHGGVQFLESIPQNWTGKDLRSTLQEMYIQMHSKESKGESTI